MWNPAPGYTSDGVLCTLYKGSSQKIIVVLLTELIM